jgi:hypothetical protein
MEMPDRHSLDLGSRHRPYSQDGVNATATTATTNGAASAYATHMVAYPIALALALLLSPTVNASEITIGSLSPTAGNCAPFSCQGSHVYQLVYSSSAFSGLGAIDLTSVSYYVDPLGLAYGSHSLTTPDFSISLSTTSMQVGALNIRYGANIGPDNTTVFSAGFTVTNATAGQAILLPFGFSDSGFLPAKQFLYNPALGNLC